MRDAVCLWCSFLMVWPRARRCTRTASGSSRNTYGSSPCCSESSGSCMNAAWRWPLICRRGQQRSGRSPKILFSFMCSIFSFFRKKMIKYCLKHNTDKDIYSFCPLVRAWLNAFAGLSAYPLHFVTRCLLSVSKPNAFIDRRGGEKLFCMYFVSSASAICWGGAGFCQSGALRSCCQPGEKRGSRGVFLFSCCHK